ncbi:MAG: hypothetical protein WC516_09315 [Patescibacteria group bacterium]|jgi:hypothetical protein
MTLEDTIDFMIGDGLSYETCQNKIKSSWAEDSKEIGLTILKRKKEAGLFNRQPNVNRISKGGLLINK